MTAAGPMESASPSDSAPAPSAPETAAAPAPAQAQDNGSATAPAAPALSNEQILQIANTANMGEAEQGRMAVSKATNAEVKKLAAMMVKDHTAASAAALALAKNNKLTPAASPVSMSLQTDTQAATTALKGQTGTDFDKAYVDTQIKEHQAVLDMLDQKLIPSATNSDLKSYLGEVRTKVAMHLQHAKDLQNAMMR